MENMMKMRTVVGAFAALATLSLVGATGKMPVVPVAGKMPAAAEKIPLPEHPRPDWQRAEWQNLNGSWCFASDKADVGVKDKWFAADDKKFPQRILVPFGWGSPN